MEWSLEVTDHDFVGGKLVQALITRFLEDEQFTLVAQLRNPGATGVLNGRCRHKKKWQV